MKKLFKVLVFWGIVLLSVPVITRAADVSINLKAWTTDGLMTDQTLLVHDCEDSPGSGNFTVNGLCAIEQSGFPATWTWWGTDSFLDAWNGYSSNMGGNSIYWAWFGNRELGPTALNTHLLAPDEELLLTYGPNPLRARVDDANPDAGQAVTITVEEFGYDADWNAVWSPAVGASVSLSDGSTGLTDALGIYSFTPANGDLINFLAAKSGFAESNKIAIDPNDPPPPPPPPSPPPPPAGGGGGGGVVLIPSSPPPKNFDLNAAVNFILNQQKLDGSFGDALYTDWVAVALGATDIDEYTGAKNNLRAYLKENPLTTGSLTDYERRSMALMALNLSPYIDGGRDYIAEIVKGFDGTQFGDPNLYNDDIFAMLALSNAGYGTDNPMIQSVARWLLAKQSVQGDFAGVDLTAAYIQSLETFKTLPDVEFSLTRAENYLRARQESSGGLGSIFGTSWAMQTLAISKESALRYLALFQISDGGLQDAGLTPDGRLWATAYAVPAALGKDWNMILSDFSIPIAPVIEPLSSPTTKLLELTAPERSDLKNPQGPTLESIGDETLLNLAAAVTSTNSLDSKEGSVLAIYFVLSIGGLLILRRLTFGI